MPISEKSEGRSAHHEYERAIATTIAGKAIDGPRALRR
jgi:hypothetical protein